MTEAQLRAQTRAALYAVAALLMAMLAWLNYQYGLYYLFYTAALFIPLFIFGSAFSILQVKRQLRETGHEVILSSAVLVIALRINHGEFGALHWLYPLGLLSFLSLSLRSALFFNIITLSLISLLVTVIAGLFDGMRFFSSYMLLAGIAGMFAYLHHHRNQSLVELSITDSMTGAYNIRHFDETLVKEVSRADDTGHPLSLISMEIDYFPQVKDVHGQAVASDLLAELSKMLISMIRAGDSLYYDGEERFYLLLPNTPTEGLLVIAERIRRRAEEGNWPVVDSISVSVGCTTLTTEHRSSKDMVNSANSALADAQKKGHNRVAHSDT
jgi:diguanylate cyclase (GGDEF)-like protein